MDKVAVYELEKKRKRPLFGGYYYQWGEKAVEDNNDDEVMEDLEKLQELHMFNR